MNLASRFFIGIKASRELGAEQLGLYALYQLGLRTGHYHRQLTSSLVSLNNFKREPFLNLHPCLPSLPERDTMLDLLGEQIDQLYKQADEIVNGEVRMFGSPPVPLVLTPPQPLLDWTNYERRGNLIGDQDIKAIWEPGRFGWACILAMAYHLSNDERYAETFWQNNELFLTSNPPYLGPHWFSAQEVAIRIIALAFALQVFTQSNQASPERLKNLAQAIAVHAERIPPTLPYSRSQNNNHLISEALGLYTASALLPEHPHAPKWHALGWKWLEYAFRTQIDPDGTYIQHSTNYHRLMLQAALLAFAVHDVSLVDDPIPEDITNRLQASTRWLWKLVDPETGRVPNLGHNDGAYILPLTVCPYHDFRPVIYAAMQTFNQTKLAPQGYWNDLSNWLSATQDPIATDICFEFLREGAAIKDMTSQPPHILQNPRNSSWAYLRVASFHSRPAHADQLHVDIWWRGLNLAQDAGTYLYNAPSPWDNSLTSALVHNTVVVDGQEFMQRAGRFLYLDWAQAEIVISEAIPNSNLLSLTAQHNGYRKIGVLHSRQVTICDDGHWEVIDQLDGSPGSVHTARLHWLLPDWDYEIQVDKESTEYTLYNIRIRSPYGWIALKLGLSETDGRPVQVKNSSLQLVRAGNLLYGSGSISPISGWASPTYGVKIPALSCNLEITQSLPIKIRSEWILPNES
jgi:hypothetical protein